MRKHLLIAATVAVVSLPTFANSPYVAVELAAGAYNTSVADPAGKQITDNLDYAGALAIKAGSYLNANIRVYGYLQHNGQSEVIYLDPIDGDHTKYQLEGYQFGAGSDYVYHLNNSFYLLAGGSLGFYQSELETSFTKSVATMTSKNSGLTYGLTTGLGYMFTDHFGMEAGYRFNYYSGNEHKVGDEPLAKFNSSNQGYINATYKF